MSFLALSLSLSLSLFVNLDGWMKRIKCALSKFVAFTNWPMMIEGKKGKKIPFKRHTNTGGQYFVHE